MASHSLYTPLPTDQLYIRLCRLSQGSEDDQPLVVELKSFKWAEVEGPYDALSYICGSPDDDIHPVSVGSTFLGVLETLWRLLLHYTKTSIPDKSRYIWMDAICINQANLKEKSIQVAAMGSIFRGARRVLV
jgi:hypothetical protein